MHIVGSRVHWLLSQYCPAAQPRPQPPQFPKSVRVLRHDPLHSVSPAAQVMGSPPPALPPPSPASPTCPPPTALPPPALPPPIADAHWPL